MEKVLAPGMSGIVLGPVVPGGLSGGPVAARCAARPRLAGLAVRSAGSKPLRKATLAGSNPFREQTVQGADLWTGGGDVRAGWAASGGNAAQHFAADLAGGHFAQGGDGGLVAAVNLLERRLLRRWACCRGTPVGAAFLLPRRVFAGCPDVGPGLQQRRRQPRKACHQPLVEAVGLMVRMQLGG